MNSSLVTIVYVNDSAAAARFYGELLGISPSFEVPGYVAFDLGPGADLALWELAARRQLPGADEFEKLSPDLPRTSEVCLAIDGGHEELDAVFQQWVSKGVNILHEPKDAGFGRTFLAADPDGNRIRVAPQD